MVKGDVSHGSEGRKATFFIVQRRQLSWILEPVNGDSFSWFKGGRLSIVPKPGKKELKEAYFGPVTQALSKPLELFGKHVVSGR